MKNIKKYVFLGIFAFSLTSESNASEITSPVLDGMALKLGNVVQRVKVRAKSMGPGACAVTFELHGESINFLSPPLTWSPWTEVGPGFTSASSQALGFTIGCDTGAIAEVKYFN
jgi:hypothetical protein